MVIYTHTQDTQDIALRIHSVYRIGSTLKETKEDYACTGRREASEGILIDLPLIPVPDQCSLCLKICLAEDCEAPPPPPPLQRREKGNGSKCRQNLKSTFLSANQRKAFIRKT